MIEFFQSIWAWLVANKDNIIGFFTSTDFIATMGSLIAIRKMYKSYNKNTLSLNSINNSISTTTAINENVSFVMNTIDEICKHTSDVTIKLNELETKVSEFMKSTTNKINAMLEVQTLVYSTVKDDDIRKTVSSILTTAKFEETSTKAQLLAEIDELKSKLLKLTQTEELVEINTNVIEVVEDSGNKRRY